MNIYLTKYNVKNLDIDEIDEDSFYEGLLGNIINIERERRRIGRQVKIMTSTPYIPVMSTKEQYDAIVDLLHIKSVLANLCNSFVRWYDRLPIAQKRFYVAYFIKKDSKLCEKLEGNRHYRKKAVPTLVNSFKTHIKTNTDIKETELIKYPLIYGIYNNTYDKKLKRDNLKKKKGEQTHDDSTDERCDSQCL